MHSTGSSSCGAKEEMGITDHDLKAEIESFSSSLSQQDSVNALLLVCMKQCRLSGELCGEDEKRVEVIIMKI